ncbi:MAG TPA: APC family permease [Steroidobacteraceae bacterium]|nr:APC family permease [Steroidobacteraceae bacterium]
MTTARPLRRILGLGFGLAFAFGTMVGVGILRLPGMVAEAAGSPALIIGCWCLGGLYALMGAVSVSELAAMYPEAGGFRVYARHAFGEVAGFIVGWIDWLATVATFAYGSVSVIEFVATRWPAVAQYEALAAIAVLGIITAMHSAGLRMGSTITSVASATIGVLLLLLILGCFFATPVAQSVAPVGVAAGHKSLLSAGALLTLVPALRAILTACDGWYAPIYTAEESLNASRTLPRSIIGGAVLVGVLYVAINAALLRVLPVQVLAASKLPVADAAQVVLPHGSASLMTALSILIVLGLINSNAIMGPRVLYSMAREGWISPKIAAVSRGGTPYVALSITTLTGAAMILSGTFNQIIATFTVLILLYYIAAFLAVFTLRRRLPQAARPYRAFGYPVSTLVVLTGSVIFLVVAIVEDWHSGLTALIFLSLCIPAYAFAARSRRVRLLELAPEVG